MKLNKHMTVGELVEMLKALPQDVLVYTEGCDCYGPSDGIRYEPNYWGQFHKGDVRGVIILRNDNLPV